MGGLGDHPAFVQRLFLCVEYHVPRGKEVVTRWWRFGLQGSQNHLVVFLCVPSLSSYLLSWAAPGDPSGDSRCFRRAAARRRLTHTLEQLFERHRIVVMIISGRVDQRDDREFVLKPVELLQIGGGLRRLGFLKMPVPKQRPICPPTL